MNPFTDEEIVYLTHQPLGRLATIGGDGRPSVRPVGVNYDPKTGCLVIAGYLGSGMERSKKFRDAVRNPDVSFVVDDLASTDPWTPRGMEIRGYVEVHHEGGTVLSERIDASYPFDEAHLLIRPRRILSWGLTDDVDDPDWMTARDVAIEGEPAASE